MTTEAEAAMAVSAAYAADRLKAYMSVRAADDKAFVEKALPPDPLLTERGKTHGRFEDNARTMQALRNFMRAEAGWQNLTDVQREALDMFCCKIGRILNGQGGFRDHWDDIAGYAKLASAGGQL